MPSDLSEPQRRALGAVEHNMAWYDGLRLRSVSGLTYIHRSTERVLFDRGYVKVEGQLAVITPAGRAALEAGERADALR